MFYLEGAVYVAYWGDQDFLWWSKGDQFFFTGSKVVYQIFLEVQEGDRNLFQPERARKNCGSASQIDPPLCAKIKMIAL